MAKTKFVDNQTILTSSFNNTIYGGLEGTTEGAGLDATDPLIGGHLHDGVSEDGHAQKISLTDHVTDELDGEMLQDSSVPNSKLIGPLGTGLQDERRIPFGSDEIFLAELDSGSDFLFLGPVSQDTILKELYIRVLSPAGIGSYQNFVHITSIAVSDGEVTGPNLMSGFMPSVPVNPRFSPIFPVTFNEVIPAGFGLQIVLFKTAALSSPDPGSLLLSVHATGVPGDTDAGLTKQTFLGCTAPTLLSAAVGGVRASDTFTVQSNPLTVGDTIDINFPLQGIKTLTGVSGPRTSGSNDFQVDAGSNAAIAADIIAAINDPMNEFEQFIEATSAGGASFDLTFWDPGDFGNQTIVDVTNAIPVQILPSFSSLDNGAPDILTLSFGPAPSDMQLKRLYTAVSNTGISSTDKGSASLFGLQFDSVLDIGAIRVNGGGNLIDGRFPCVSTNNTDGTISTVDYLGLMASPNFQLDILEGDTLEVDMVINFNIPATTPIAVFGWTAELT